MVYKHLLNLGGRGFHSACEAGAGIIVKTAAQRHVHSHAPEGDVTLAGLMALGASGGLAPSPWALVPLLSAVALGRVGLGLLLLVSFSLGLAVVLMGIGRLVLYARNLLPESKAVAAHPFFRLLPVLSAG